MTCPPLLLTITSKTLILLVCVTSVGYTGACSWSLSLHRHEAASTHRTVILTTLSVSIVASLLQAISALNLMFKSTSDSFKTAVRYWAVTQAVLWVIVVVAFLIPFSFSPAGGHESGAKFLENTGHHFGGVVDDIKGDWKVEHMDHAVTIAAVVHAICVLAFVGGTVIAWECCSSSREQRNYRSGYTGIK